MHKKAENTRVKVKQRKKTVGITLPEKLVKRARKHNLNLSRIAEQALISILDCLETQNLQKGSGFLSAGSFLKESAVVPRAELEPATNVDISRAFSLFLEQRFLFFHRINVLRNTL